MYAETEEEKAALSKLTTTAASGTSTTKSAEVEFDMRIPVDLFNSSMKFLPPNVSFKLRCIRNDSNYGLIYAGNNKYNIRLEDCRLQLRKIILSPFALEKYRSKLQTQEAHMNYKTGKIRTFQIAKDLTSLNINQIAVGTLPTSLVIGFVDADSFSGAKNTDPFRFNHFNLSKMNLKIGGANVLPKTFQPVWTAGEERDIAYMYRALMDHTGFNRNGSNLDITKSQFKDNRFFIAYDLTPDLCYSAHNHLPKKGDISVELGWAAPGLSTNIVMVVYMVYDAVLSINNYSQINVSTT